MKFLRAPMGLISSGDEYNRRGDAALGDIPRTLKIVDDLLLPDATYIAHLSLVVAVLDAAERQASRSTRANSSLRSRC